MSANPPANWARGAAFILILVTTAMVGCLGTAFSLPFLAVARFGSPPRSPRAVALCGLANAVADQISGQWFHMVAFLLRHLMGNTVFTHAVVPKSFGGAADTVDVGNGFARPPAGKTTIYVVNHHTRVDWLLLWAYWAQCHGTLFALRIVLKASLAKAPWFGWAMQYFRFLFLSRKWEHDRPNVVDAVSYWKTAGESTVLLIFPEGTDLSDGNLKRSHEWAEKNGLPKYNQVLHPKTTGVDEIRRMVGVDNIHEIVDVTMGFSRYHPTERPSDKSLVKGRVPPGTHLLLRRFRFGAAPASSTSSFETGGCFYLSRVVGEEATGGAFCEWIKARFREKEALLTAFQETRLADPKASPAEFAPRAWRPHLLDSASERIAVAAFPPTPVHLRVLVPLLWIAMGVALPMFMVATPWFRWCNLLLWAFYAIETSVTGGVDRWLCFPTLRAPPGTD